MNSNEAQYHAVSCRVKTETYEIIKQFSDNTGKSVSHFVSDAVTYYAESIKGNKTPTEALLIDEFAYNLKNSKNRKT